jgi:hypothetical protein
MSRPEDQDSALQETYARWLDAGTRSAFAVSLAAFLLYLSGALPPYVPLGSLPELWKLPLAEYLARTGAPTGWQWLAFVARGDYLNYVGIGMFALVIAAADLAILPLLLKRGERLLAGLALAQILVLFAAASGRLAGG